MKNYEKYADEIREYKGCNFCVDFVCQHILKIEDCDYIGCSRCNMLQMLWLLDEYKEPKEPETEYKGGVVYALNNGGTSWTVDCVTAWKFAKLAETEGTE